MFTQPTDYYAKFENRDDLPQHDMAKHDFSYPSREEVPKMPTALRHIGSHMWVINDDYQVLSHPPLSFSKDTGTLCLQVRAPQRTPLFAIDGNPVVAGNGDIYILLPTGTHMVEAQEISTVDPVIVDIKTGGTTTLQYASEPNFPVITFSHRHAGLPLLLKAPYMPPKLPAIGALGAIAVSSAVGLWMATSDALLGVIVFLAILTCLYIAWAPIEMWARRKAAEEVGLLRQLRAEGPKPYPWGTCATTRTPYLVGNQPVELPELEKGHGALALHLLCHRHRVAPTGPGDSVTDSISHPHRDLATLMTRAPKVWIDGKVMPATWGSWWYPLPPGDHRVTVEVHGRADQPYTHDSTNAELTKRRDMTVTVKETEAVAVSAEAHTYFIKRHTGFEFYQPRLWVEPGHPDHFLKEMKRE